jgi:cytochrome P450
MAHQWNLMDPAIRRNPYPVYAQMRRESPVCRVAPGGRWVITRFADVVEVLKNPRLFSSAGIGRSSQPAWLGRHNPFADSMLVMDPPQHGRLRALVSRAFAGPAVNGLEADVRELSAKLAAELPSGATVDFVDAFAMQLPSRVLSELLGLDLELRTRFKRWSDDIVGIGAIEDDDPSRHIEVRRTVDEMEAYFGDVLEARRRDPRTDLVGELLAARVDGESLTDAEIMGFLFLLLVAGLETTVHLLSHSVNILLDHPTLADRLRADPSYIEAFIEEALRYEPPVHGAARITTMDAEVSGVRLPAGSPVVALVGSACRDEEYAPDPDRFDLDRARTQHLPFGHGAHYCLGARLARAEGRLAIEALLPRLVDMRRSGDVEWNTSMIVRGPSRLPIQLR